MTACSVFVDELRRIREAKSAWPEGAAAAAADSEHETYASLQDGLRALNTFARESLLMRKFFDQ